MLYCLFLRTQNDISILQLYRQRMYDSAKSICETFTQVNTNSTPPMNATCSGNASSVVVNSLRTSSCSWVSTIEGSNYSTFNRLFLHFQINSVSSSILPECKSHLQEIDLTCHEIQLADLAFKVTFTLTGSNSYRARENLDNWVSRFVDPNQMSKEAFRLITRRIH